jgi:DNA-binding transcriptional regulator YdaS (Cro superfamily)
MKRDPILLRAIEIAGGPAALGAFLGISHAAVAQWKRCPAERAIQLEQATGGQVTRQELRPDLYPEAA